LETLNSSVEHEACRRLCGRDLLLDCACPVDFFLVTVIVSEIMIYLIQIELIWQCRSRKAVAVSVRRDEQGYIIKEDLQYDTTGSDVSQDLGASAGYVSLPERVNAILEKVRQSPKSITFEETMAVISDEV
jgi:hypothetical protein